MGKYALAVMLFLCVPALKADTITDEVATMITQNSVLPLAAGVSLELAQNLMTAQADSTYAASEPDSLTLSYASVLRAIWLEDTLANEKEIMNAMQDPWPFIQSQIAIDDRAAVDIFVNGHIFKPGDVINFGSVPVSEPDALILLLGGLDSLLIFAWVKRRA